MVEARADELTLRIEALNELRCFKLVACLQYRHHALMAKGLGKPGARFVFGKHARHSLDHADHLAERISELHGIPVFEPDVIGEIVAAEHSHVKTAPTIRGMALANLTLERKQIRMYQPLIRLLAFEDPATRTLLEDILRHTESQASTTFRLLQRVAETEMPQILPVSEPTRKVLSYLDLRDQIGKAVGA